MLVILDSNEYIFALGTIRKETCERLIEEVALRADAFIAAYTEYVGADILASENRHFRTHHSNLPFKILTAEKCLSLIKRPLK